MKIILKILFVLLLKSSSNAEEHFQCPTDTQREVSLPNPQDCSSYYKCSDGEANLEYCSPGMEFNPERKLCDSPDHMNCNDPIKDARRKANEPNDEASTNDQQGRTESTNGRVEQATTTTNQQTTTSSNPPSEQNSSQRSRNGGLLSFLLGTVSSTLNYLDNTGNDLLSSIF